MNSISPQQRAEYCAKYAVLQHDLHFPETVSDPSELMLGRKVEYSTGYFDHPWAGRFVADHREALRHDLGWLPKAMEQSHGYQEPTELIRDDSLGANVRRIDRDHALRIEPGMRGWDEYAFDENGNPRPAPSYTRSGIYELTDHDQPLLLLKDGIDPSLQRQALDVAREDPAAPCLLWWSMDTLDAQYRDRRLVLYPVSIVWTLEEYARALLRRALEIRRLQYLREEPELEPFSGYGAESAYERQLLDRAKARKSAPLLQCDRDRYDRSPATDWSRMGRDWQRYRRELNESVPDYSIHEDSTILLVMCGPTVIMAALGDRAKAQCDSEGSGLSWFTPDRDGGNDGNL